MLVDESFHIPRTPVAVVAIDGSGEALLVRSILESLHAVVILHLMGTPEDFLRVLGQGESAPRYMIICGHGDEAGLVFGEYGENIDVSALQLGLMAPSVIAKRVNLPGRIVVSTACQSGAKAFGEAFLRGGVAAYIAPDGAPHAYDAPLFIHLLFHHLLQRRSSLASALRQAKGYDSELQMFTCFPSPRE